MKKHVPGQVYDLYVTLEGDVVDCIRQVRTMLTIDQKFPCDFASAKVRVDKASIFPGNVREVKLLDGAAPKRLRTLFRAHKIDKFRIELSADQRDAGEPNFEDLVKAATAGQPAPVTGATALIFGMSCVFDGASWKKIQ